jgi:hypothetical protein
MRESNLPDHFSAAPRLSIGAGRDVIWQLIDGIGLEHCRLVATAERPLLTGKVITVDDEELISVDYAVQCDPNWHTREVAISVLRSRSDNPASLQLISDGDGNWWQVAHDERTALPHLAGCFDVDIAVTPSTNTLPIRRINLAPGAKARVTAAWVQFPSLEVTTLPQQYTRIDGDRYRYESFPHNFVATLEVDDLDLVRTYGDLWSRVAEADLA